MKHGQLARASSTLVSWRPRTGSRPVIRSMHRLDAGQLVAERAAPPGPGVRCVVSPTPGRVHPEGPAGGHGSRQVVGLGDHDQLLDAEDPFRPGAGVVGVEPGVVGHHGFRRHPGVDQVAAHGVRLVVLRGHVVPGHQDHAHLAGLVQTVGQVEPRGEERRRRAARGRPWRPRTSATGAGGTRFHGVEMAGRAEAGRTRSTRPARRTPDSPTPARKKAARRRRRWATAGELTRHRLLVSGPRQARHA